MNMTPLLHYPSLSVVVPTLNNGSEIEYFLQSVEGQTYPKEKVEILICDGGSTDKTREICMNHHTTIIDNKNVLADAGVNLGIGMAKGEVLMVLAVDNLYRDTLAFQKIACVFRDPEIFAAFPKHVSEQGDSIFCQYINTFTDPFNHFVYGDAANARSFYKLYRTIKHTDIYDVYDYKSCGIKPLLAFAQGFSIRNKFVRKSKDTHDDIGPVISLIEENKQIAYIHSLPLYHRTIRDVSHFVRKTKWATMNALMKRAYGVSHRTYTFTQLQKVRMAIWPFYAMSIIFPLIWGVIRSIQRKEILWLFHPIICFVSVYSSITVILMSKFSKNIMISRQ